MKKTHKMFLLDIFESGIALLKVIINAIVCNRKSLKVKWEQEANLSRAVEQIEKDLDVV